jgi:tetratricopeptide (TPR) repeat protein
VLSLRMQAHQALEDFPACITAGEALKALGYPGELSTERHANCLRRAGRFAEALTLLDALEIARPSAWTAVERSLTLTGLGEGEAALAALDTALARTPGYIHALRARPDALWRLARWAEMADAARAWLAVDPDAGQAHLALGVSLDHLKNTAAARDSFARAVSLDPTLAPAWNNLGAMHDRLGEDAEAVEAFRQAASAAPDVALYRTNLALALTATGAFAEARAALEAAAALNAHPLTLETVRATLTAAEAEATRAAAVRAELSAGEELLAAERWAQAMDHFQSLEAKPGFILAERQEAVQGRALALTGQGRPCEGLAVIRAATALDTPASDQRIFRVASLCATVRGRSGPVGPQLEALRIAMDAADRSVARDGPADPTLTGFHQAVSLAAAPLAEDGWRERTTLAALVAPAREGELAAREALRRTLYGVLWGASEAARLAAGPEPLAVLHAEMRGLAADLPADDRVFLIGVWGALVDTLRAERGTEPGVRRANWAGLKRF